MIAKGRTQIHDQQYDQYLFKNNRPKYEERKAKREAARTGK